jgi:hypothetical protein
MKEDDGCSGPPSFDDSHLRLLPLCSLPDYHKTTSVTAGSWYYECFTANESGQWFIDGYRVIAQKADVLCHGRPITHKDRNICPGSPAVARTRAACLPRSDGRRKG